MSLFVRHRQLLKAAQDLLLAPSSTLGGIRTISTSPWLFAAAKPLPQNPVVEALDSIQKRPERLYTGFRCGKIATISQLSHANPYRLLPTAASSLRGL